MGITVALAGRFSFDHVAEVARELEQVNPERQFGGWGVAYCYGTLLRSARMLGQGPGFDFESLADAKTDMAVLHLTDAGETPLHPHDLQPFLRKDSPLSQAFVYDGRILQPKELETGRRVPGSQEPGQLFFLHVLEAFDPDDPLESVVRMHKALPDEPDQAFFLLNNDALVVSTWKDVPDPDVERSETSPSREEQPALWLGQGGPFRVLAPTQLECFRSLSWEPVVPGSVIVLTRLRYEVGQAGH